LLGYPYSVPNIKKVAVSFIYGMNSQMALTGICALDDIVISTFAKNKFHFQ
jgi:hypothetical protein